jgi:dihydroorotase
MAAPELIIRGARWQDAPVDLLIAKGRVLELLPWDEKITYESARIVDAHELTLLPSLIDVHTHLRQPGHEYKEDIQSGLEAAAYGGFGVVFAMANTKPTNDNAAVTAYMLDEAQKHWPKGPRLLPIGALTKGLEGKELAPMAEMAEAGCVAFSNDGRPVESTELFRHGVEYASSFGKLVIDHCEDPWLAPAAGVNESELSGRLGLKGQPPAAEAIQVARDILLADLLRTPIHLAHISCRRSVELIAWAKERGIPITAETCPHYLLYTEQMVDGYNTNAKVNPPLRTADDVEALLQALRTGVIDCLATDHAPHAAHEKETTFDDAPCGVSGLDAALSLTWSLVQNNALDLETLLRAWRYAPAQIFGLPEVKFQPGDPADCILFDADARWELTPQAMRSKGKNTPALGELLPGRVQAHFLAGKRIV